MKFKFKKYSGHGNDFVLIDQRKSPIQLEEKDIIQICDRRFGIGADGVIFISEAKGDHDYAIKVLNLDGSEASMCGNASRIGIAYHHEQSGKDHFSFETKNSVYEGRFENGEAIIKMSELFDIDAVDISDFGVLGGLYLNTGVPHTVIEVKDLDNLDIIEVGAKIRHDERFDGGTNVCFFEVIGSREVNFRVFERGVEGETHCCGTGVIATAVTCKKLFNWSGKVKVNSLGGTVYASLNDDLTEIFYSGEVTHCFDGEYETR